MSHKGNDIFRESLQETRREKVYEQAELPDRCFTSIDSSDKKAYLDELVWRTEHCWKPMQKPAPKFTNVTLPSNDDEDYWREREEQADRLQEIYAEAKLYRDL